MGILLIFVVFGLPAAIVGYRGYMTGKGFAWLRRSWIRLVWIALGIYVGWALLDALFRNVFGLTKGLWLDAWTVMFLCLLLPAISGFGLMIGYQAAVIHRSHTEKSWSRLKDLWRRN